MPSFNLQVNPYSQGVRLNSDPYTHFFLHQQAKSRAKEEAFDGYLENLQKTITPAGMRTQDVTPLTEKAKEWQQFGIQNKKFIQNPTLDGGKALTQFRGMHQDLLGITAKSKDAVARASDLAKLKSDPKTMRLIMDEDIEDWKFSDLPVTDPNYKPFSLPSQYKEEPFDVKEANEYTGYLIGKMPPKAIDKGTRPDPNDKSKVIRTYEYNYDKNAIAQRAVTAYKTNPRIRAEIAAIADRILPTPNQFDNTQMDKPPEFDLFNEKFKKFTGRDIVRDEDVAVAHGLMLADQKSTEEKPEENKEYDRRMDNAEWDRRRRLSNADTRANMRLRKALGGDTKDADELINDMYGRIVTQVENNREGRVMWNQLPLDIQQTLKAALTPEQIKDETLYVEKLGDGSTRLMKEVISPDNEVTGEPVMKIDYRGVNIRGNNTEKGRKKVLSKEASQPTSTNKWDKYKRQ